MSVGRTLTLSPAVRTETSPTKAEPDDGHGGRGHNEPLVRPLARYAFDNGSRFSPEAPRPRTCPSSTNLEDPALWSSRKRRPPGKSGAAIRPAGLRSDDSRAQGHGHDTLPGRDLRTPRGLRSDEVALQARGRGVPTPMASGSTSIRRQHLRGEETLLERLDATGATTAEQRRTDTQARQEPTSAGTRAPRKDNREDVSPLRAATTSAPTRTPERGLPAPNCGSHGERRRPSTTPRARHPPRTGRNSSSPLKTSRSPRSAAAMLNTEIRRCRLDGCRRQAALP